jgi:D-alanyl-lipoteichoic acid acyltransferase DltB (MBOAT superfamily)
VLNFAFGRMLGFHFPKNFDLSYRVRSITEF